MNKTVQKFLCIFNNLLCLQNQSRAWLFTVFSNLHQRAYLFFDGGQQQVIIILLKVSIKQFEERFGTNKAVLKFFVFLTTCYAFQKPSQAWLFAIFSSLQEWPNYSSMVVNSK
jgi:hypothetical protein